MSGRTASPTIDDVLTAFLAEQDERLAPRTFRTYAEVIGLLCDCLNGYGPNSLDEEERQRWRVVADRDDDAFVHLFGPDKIVENLGEFLGYFMVRKVAAGDEFLRSAGTVTKKLSRWLGDRGYLDAGAVDDAVGRGGAAARDLPNAQELSRLLFEQSCASTLDVHALGAEDHIENFLTIERTAPRALWFTGGIGPVVVPKAASDIAQPGWSVWVALGRVRTRWHLLEVGSVYP